jgi:hypothetical protein
VFIFAEQGRSDDDNPTLDGRANAASAFGRREALEQGRKTVGWRIGWRREWGYQNALSGRCFTHAPPGPKRGKAQGDPTIGQASNGGRAADPAIRLELQIEDSDP